MLIALRVQTFTNDRKTRSQNQLTRHQTYTLKTYMYRRSLCRISNKKEKKKRKSSFWNGIKENNLEKRRNFNCLFSFSFQEACATVPKSLSYQNW